MSAPKLHEVLRDEEVCKLSYGGKGVGSQGDGCVQFIAKSEEAKLQLVSYLTKKGFDAFSFTIPRSLLVRKAIIPVAGFGTRMYPATKVVKKELLPVIDRSGVAKPALLLLLEELDQAGIEQIALVIQPGTKEQYQCLFEPVSEQNLVKLPTKYAEYEAYLRMLKRKIVFIEQDSQIGLGHAVYQCRDFMARDPILLCLGDHIYASNSDRSCTQQLLECFETHQKLTVSITETEHKNVGLYGIAYGAWENMETRNVMHITRFVEKPSIQTALENLGESCRAEVKYYTVFGQYVLTSDVFDQLGANIKNRLMENGEYQLTSALDTVLEQYGAVGIRIDGKRYDLGVPEQYRACVSTFGALD